MLSRVGGVWSNKHLVTINQSKAKIMKEKEIKQIISKFGQKGSTANERYFDIPGEYIVDGYEIAQICYFSDTDELLVYRIDMTDNDNCGFIEFNKLDEDDQLWIAETLEGFSSPTMRQRMVNVTIRIDYEYDERYYDHDEADIVAAETISDNMASMLPFSEHGLYFCGVESCGINE